MAAFANVVLNDAAATPVAHTFAPETIDAAGVAKWKDRSGGIAIGYPAISLSVRLPTKDSRNSRVTVKVVTPILEVTSPSTATGIQPAPTLAYNLLFTGEIVLPERSTLQQRKDLLAYIQGMLANSNTVQAILNYESVF